jgi:hypothetical protein
MTFEAGVNQDRVTLAGMAIRATFRIGLMQDIFDQSPPVTAMRVVARTAVAKFSRGIGVLLLHRPELMATQAKCFRTLDQKIWIG